MNQEQSAESITGAISESDKRFRVTFERAAAGMAHVDLDGRFREVNDAWCTISGYSRDALLRSSFQELTAPEDRSASDEARRAMLAGTIPSFVSERRYRRPTGEFYWIRLATTLTRDPSGNPELFISVIQDITETKLAEQRLVRLNRLYAVLTRITEATVGVRSETDLYGTACRIAAADGHLRLVTVAATGADGTQVTPVAWCGPAAGYLRHFVAATSGPMSEGTIGTALKTGEFDVCNDIATAPRMMPWRHAALDAGLGAAASFPLKRGGKTVAALVVFATEADYFQDDEVGLMVSFANNLSLALDGLETETARQRDLDERKAVAEKLADQASLLERARDSILVRDLDRRVTYCNLSTKELYGWSPADAIGRSFDELVTVPAELLEAAEEQVILTGQWSGEIEVTTDTGTSRIIDCRWTLLRDDTGRPKAILAIDTDITDRKTLEREILRAQRMDSLGTLAGGIAHDLNNMLAPILMSIGALRVVEDREEASEILSSIESCANRCADMVGQVLSFARGVEGVKVDLTVEEVIHNVVTILRDGFGPQIDIQVTPDPDLWAISGDPTLLQQVVLNLCLNARDAMPDGGVLSLTASNTILDEQYVTLNAEARPGPAVVIRVEDTGTGIPDGVLERMFDPFFTTKEVGKGTGLGLSTSRAIVKSHDGFIQVRTEAGKGSLFEVFLPALSQGAIFEYADTATAPTGNGELVLIVDDETVVREVTRQTVERFGYRAIVAADGAEAVAILATHKDEIAVVLTDLTMPVMDGFAAIPVLRRMDPSLRIIATSGLSDPRVAQLGVQYFLRKPYTSDALLTTLARVLRTPAAECRAPSAESRAPIGSPTAG